MARKREKSVKSNEDTPDTQELATTVERRRSVRNKEAEQQRVDDTLKRKPGRPKKSKGGSQETEDAAGGDGIESAPTPGEQSGPEKAKRGRGRPKKPRGDRQTSEAAFLEQSPSLPPDEEQQPGHGTVAKPDTILEEEAEVQTVDDTKKRKRKSKGGSQETDDAAGGDGIESAPTPGEQSGPEKAKRGRGRPKKPRGDRQTSEAAFLEQSPSLPPDEEQQPGHGTVAKPDTILEEEAEVQTVDDTKKRKRKSQDEAKEFEAASVKDSPLLPPEDDQPADNSVTHRRNGKGKNSDADGQEPPATADDDNHIQKTQLAVDSDSKHKRGRPKKLQGDQQVATQEQQPIKHNKQKRNRGKLDEEGLDQADGRDTPPLVPGADSTAATLNSRKGRSSTSGRQEQDQEEAIVGKHSTTESTGEQNSEEKHKRKSGRLGKRKKAEKELDATEERVRQGTPPDEEPVTEEKQKRKSGKPEKSNMAEKEPEAKTVVIESAPSSEEQPVDEKPKRKSGRSKKSKIESEETKPEGGGGAADGGQHVNGRRRSGRTKAGGKEEEAAVSKKSTSRTGGLQKEEPKASARAPKRVKKHVLSTTEVGGTEFQVGDDVYVKKSEGEVSESETEVEDCRVCGTSNDETMLECDDCLAGFHLKCLFPPLEAVPEGDWICPYCEKGETPPDPAGSQRRHRSARERLLARELWAARIDRIWREADGTLWFTAHWFLVPEETALGRQPHNGKRELFRSNRTDDNEMDSILRHCNVMSPKDYKNSSGEGDDVFFCEYEYNEQWCKFKRLEYDNENWSEDDQPFDPSDESEEDGIADESDGRKRRRSIQGKRLQPSKSIKAANKRHNYSKGIEEVGAKSIPDGVRKRPQTEFDRAKAALALSAVPTSLPCRDRERKEISSFLRDSVGAGEQCLGRCLYISGVPGTGKTATVLEVIKELGSKVESGELPPYRFVEINGLRLPSPEHAYTILHEALTGQHVGWKRALQYLDERFSKAEPGKGVDARPTVLLVDELDLLVTRNQLVLYNIFDWPTRPQSRLVIIGIANTMDLPERMLPRIASRMGMHRISFSPYSHKQLEEIISARLEGIQVFDKQAAEFASRKVAAVSGDTRRALELCRRAVEVAEARLKPHSSSVPAAAPSAPSSNGGTPITQDGQKAPQENGGSIVLADVDAAISEMFEAPQIQMMKRSSKLAKIFLVAMIYEQRRTSMAETTFEKIASTCSELCGSNGEERPDWDTLLSVGCKLGACRLLLSEPAAQHRLQKLQLNFPCDDVSFALKKDEDCPWLTKYL